MARRLPSSLDVNSILRDISACYRGPGGAAAVLRDGEVLGQYVWGYADLERRIPFTPMTILPICSISKQMVCLAMASLAQRPTPKMIKTGGSLWEQLAAELTNLLPQFCKPEDGLRVEHLYNMSSGIRDYWAMTTLWGGKPDDPFSLANDAPKALERSKSFHFVPGAEYSYSNLNFYILARILENVSGQSLNQLLALGVFIPAGMTTAALQPNTYGHPLPIVGYEYSEERGHMAAVNRIEWSGDAGIVASLEDMIAYEKWLHRSYSEPQSSYATIAKEQFWNDGNASSYAFGLKRGRIGGRTRLGHGGGLRGFSLRRDHLPAEKLSVVVMFNHHAGAPKAAKRILKQILQVPDEETHAISPIPEWFGDFLDIDTQLLVTVKPAKVQGKVSIKYERTADIVPFVDPVTAESDSISAWIDAKSGLLTVKRHVDNRILSAHRIATAGAADSAPSTSSQGDYAGVYHCEESESTFHCTGEGGMMYGAFDGYLGRGQMLMMRYVGTDVWALANPRAMDAAPPGDWTVVFKRDARGSINNVTIGCWLARKIEYTRIK